MTSEQIAVKGVAGEAMRLPVGATCADCVHVRGCVNMGFTWRTRTMCDFYPNRFAMRRRGRTP